MKHLFSILLSAFLLWMPVASVLAEDVNVSTADTTNQTAVNRAIFDRVYNTLKADADLPMNELVVKVGLQFLGTHYLWASLESVPEELHVFLDKTDCILFVEMSTCFALTIKGKKIVQAGDGIHYDTFPVADAGKQVKEPADVARYLIPSLEDAKPSYELLCHNIRNMRYRLGHVDGYSSRIHYTSEWLLQNRRNGLMREYSYLLGEEFPQHFFYMSMHPNTYYQLSQDPCELGRIRMMEDRLEHQAPYYYISQERLRDPEVMKQIHSGDIITFISPRPGLDLAHVAIAYEVNGEMHFIHASYGKKKVVIEEKTLADYASNGIRITRLAPLN